MSNKIMEKIEFSKKYTPQNDFYKYVNGKWEDKVIIPDDYSSWGISEVLYEETMQKLKNIIEKSNNKLLKGYYNSFMNTKQRDELGFSPLTTYLTMIENRSNNKQYEIFEILTKSGFSNLFYIYAEPDSKDSDTIRPYFIQGGLELPEKDYYFNNKFADIRKKYIKLIKDTFIMLNYDKKDSDKISKNIFNLERGIAKHWLSPEEHRNVDNSYNMIEMKDFFSPDMCNCLTNLGITNKIILDNPKYYKYINRVLENEDLKYFFIWKLVSSCSSCLSTDFYNLMFNFYGKEMSGQKKPKKLWMRGISYVNSTVGEILGDLYVKKYFPESSKKKMLEMIKNLKEALKQHINGVDWMENKTKIKALKKLNEFRFKIGYPNKLRDYSSIKIRDNVFYNRIEFNMFDYQTDLVERLEKKVDKDRWEMLPHRINAYFHPELNEIVFPAAILQPPYFDPNADDAYNYGSIGTVIGHEMTHGYDDQGRKYDYTGNLNDWWTTNDSKKYDEKAKRIIEQYNNYELYNTKVNGDLTQGENIADLGGLKVSYTAYLNSNKNASLEDKKKFFISYAFSWREKGKKESIINQIAIDEHSPSEFRVNGALYNCKEFFDVYCCRKGDKMFNENIIKIW